MSAQDWQALWLSLQLAGLTTAILLVLGTPLAWWLAHSRWRGRAWLEALIALPLVLPPTVLGFYLLVLLAPDGLLGRWLGGVQLVFSFPGLVLASVLYSLPFVVQPLQNRFHSLGTAPLETAATLGAGPWQRFRHAVLPLSRDAYLTAAVLGFAHTLGEFGVVLMIGGNIPGVTQVASIAIYEHVEAMDYASAHALSAVLLGLSFAMLLLVYRRRGRAGP